MPLTLRLDGTTHDLGGGFVVRRLLPSPHRRAVGPFVFFDHFGPTLVEPGSNLDVRPHPHIGLATVTYLFEGAMQHRDSLGHAQRIEPGAINWMNAGRGIVHSERRPADLAGRPYRLHGLQLWTALPAPLEDSAPSFTHTPAQQLAPFAVGPAEVRVLVGSAFGRASPVVTHVATTYVALRFTADGAVEIPPGLAAELALYVVEGALEADGEAAPGGTLHVVEPNRPLVLAGRTGTTAVLVGGEPLDGPRIMWWNFVATRPGLIRRAAEEWAAGRMPPVPGEQEFIPLPDRPLPD